MFLPYLFIPGGDILPIREQFCFSLELVVIAGGLRRQYRRFVFRLLPRFIERATYLFRLFGELLKIAALPERLVQLLNLCQRLTGGKMKQVHFQSGDESVILQPVSEPHVRMVHHPFERRLNTVQKVGGDKGEQLRIEFPGIAVCNPRCQLFRHRSVITQPDGGFSNGCPDLRGLHEKIP